MKGGKEVNPHEILTVVISAIGVIAAVVTGFIGYQNGLKKNSSRNGEERGVLMTEIGYIKAGIDDIKTRQDRQDREYSDLKIEVAEIKRDLKTAFSRIDDLKGGK